MTSYDNQASASDTHQESIIDKLYVRSFDGIVKVSEIAIDVTVIICSAIWVDNVSSTGGGWVQFVSISGLILAILVYTLYVFQIQPKIAKLMAAKKPKYPWDLCEAIYNLTYAAFYLICAILGSVYGSKHSSIAAAAFFCYCGVIAYGIDVFRCFQRYKNIVPPSSTSGTGSGAPSGDSSGGPQY